MIVILTIIIVLVIAIEWNRMEQNGIEWIRIE